MDATATAVALLLLAAVCLVGVTYAAVITLRARRRTKVHVARERESTLAERLEQVERRDERLTRREETLEAKAQTLEMREANLLERERGVAAERAELDDTLAVQRKHLEEIADYTLDEARQALIEQAEADARRDAQVLARDVEAHAREEAERRAREIVASAVQRVAVDTTSATTTALVSLPDEDYKGRIIGRDGRNIRAFEQLTGADLVVDDTPDAVVVSCFDPFRRETARVTLERLVADGRIHPAAIESEHARATAHVEEETLRNGRSAADEAGVEDLPPEVIRLLGELTYRTSYGQNVLRHSVETAALADLMAGELGVDAGLARRCGLLHDVGKALTHKVSGSHARVGAEVLRRLDESEAVCHAVAAHHNEVKPESVAAVLTQAADACSAARPGARCDAHEHYITRLRRIEELCAEMEGVQKVHAMQAGRDVRVMVSPDEVDDAAARALARDLAGRIENELAYPGQITITVVRELRASETAR